MDILSLSRDASRRVAASVRAGEADRRSEDTASSDRRSNEPLQLVRVTGPAVAGVYPAVLVRASAAGVTDGGAVRFKPVPARGYVPTTGNGYVLARYCGRAADGAFGLYIGTATMRVTRVPKHTYIDCLPGGGYAIREWTVDVYGPAAGDEAVSVGAFELTIDGEPLTVG